MPSQLIPTNQSSCQNSLRNTTRITPKRILATAKVTRVGFGTKGKPTNIHSDNWAGKTQLDIDKSQRQDGKQYTGHGFW